MAEQTKPEKATYTVPEAAAILGIGLNVAYKAAKTGDIPAIQIGKRYLVPRVQLEKMLAGE